MKWSEIRSQYPNKFILLGDMVLHQQMTRKWKSGLFFQNPRRYKSVLIIVWALGNPLLAKPVQYQEQFQTQPCFGERQDRRRNY